MSTTTSEMSAKYKLKPGELWWVCDNCKAILGKIMSSGVLQMKTPSGFRYVRPQKKSVVDVTGMCGCEDPPHRNVLTLTCGE